MWLHHKMLIRFQFFVAENVFFERKLPLISVVQKFWSEKVRLSQIWNYFLSFLSQFRFISFTLLTMAQRLWMNNGENIRLMQIKCSSRFHKSCTTILDRVYQKLWRWRRPVEIYVISGNGEANKRAQQEVRERTGRSGSWVERVLRLDRCRKDSTAGITD